MIAWFLAVSAVNGRGVIQKLMLPEEGEEVYFYSLAGVALATIIVLLIWNQHRLTELRNVTERAQDTLEPLQRLQRDLDMINPERDPQGKLTGEAILQVRNTVSKVTYEEYWQEHSQFEQKMITALKREDRKQYHSLLMAQ